VIVGTIRRNPVLTHTSIVCEGMLASVNSVKKIQVRGSLLIYRRWLVGERVVCLLHFVFDCVIDC